MTPSTPETVPSFYDRWARLYAGLARVAPGIGRCRDDAVEGLGLTFGDRVVDMGCGPGVNFDLLERAVGPEGTVVGIDVSPRMIRLAEAEAGDQTHAIVGDATRPPVDGPFDGLLSTFVITLFDDPTPIIDRWWDLLRPGGRLAMVNLAPARGPLGPPMNCLLDIGLAISTPTRDQYDKPLRKILNRRLVNAHDAVTDRAASVRYSDEWDATIRVIVATKPTE